MSSSDTRLFSFVFTVLAVIALALASTGLYAVISQSVNQRLREMAIRLALGASGAYLWRFVFFQGLRRFVIGLALGLPLSLAVGGLLGSLLIDISSSDPMTWLLVVIVLTLTAIFACGLPAIRAARCEPAIVLRFE